MAFRIVPYTRRNLIRGVEEHLFAPKHFHNVSMQSGFVPDEITGFFN
jgi:hypothetical protein